MNPAVQYENSSFQCSPTSTTDMSPTFAVDKSQRIRKRTMSMSVMPTPTPTPTTTSNDDNFSKVFLENENNPQRNKNSGIEKQKRDCIQSQSRGIGRPIPRSLANLRAHLDSSASSSSSSSCNYGNGITSPIPTVVHQKNSLRRKNTIKSPPTSAAQRTQKHRHLKKQQQQQQQQQHYREEQNIFRQTSHATVTTPLHHRPFKQQRSFSPSPRTATTNYDTDRLHIHSELHLTESKRITPHQNSNSLEFEWKEELDSSLTPTTSRLLASTSASASASASPPPLPPLWTEGFAHGVADSVKKPVDRMISAGNLMLQPRRTFWSRLKPQDIVRVRSITSSEDEDSERDDDDDDDEEHEHEEVDDENDGLAVLGCGSFSSVTRVGIRGKGTTCSYALKHLKQDLLPSRLTIQSLRNGSTTAFERAATELAREAYLLSRFDHPHIVNIVGWTEGGVASYSTFRRHDAFFLVLELLQEETLDDRIDRWNHDDAQLQLQLGTCSQEKRKSHFIQRKIEQLTICRQVASALAYIHAKNVVYRDLKPQNIGFAMIDEDRGSGNEREEENDGSNVVVKLMDFGLAREIPLTTGPGTLLLPNKELEQDQATHSPQSVAPSQSLFDMTGTVGTLRYMAPEVCLHRPYGLECDIYSWSIVAHEILSQTKPYEDMTPDMYQTLVCQQGVRPQRNDLPSEYAVLLSQTWRTDPSKRLPLIRIQEQLDLFLQKEKIIWEARELLLGMPESNEYPISLSRSFAEKGGEGIGMRGSNKRSYNQHQAAVRSNNSHNGIFPNSSMRCFNSGYPDSNCHSPSPAPRGPIPMVANNSYSYSPDSFDGDGYYTNYTNNNLYMQIPQRGYHHGQQSRDAGSPGRHFEYYHPRQRQHLPHHHHHPQDLMIPQQPLPNSFGSPAPPAGTEAFSSSGRKSNGIMRMPHLEVRPSHRNQGYYENNAYNRNVHHY